ncbi:hypothetical protein HRI_000549500 [Hibiscus trionum]|uniref:Secreted protein n=1 Tax=Hibiscus trionum TaxID=183268 RepID=A0A9W7H193_HIBTR|nr:hypothetical protein HRI_000549500 [Hibiscus trionum]
MRRFCLLLVVLAMVLLSDSASVDCCRPLRSTNTIGDATGDAVRVGLDSAENGRGRGLEEKQVETNLAAGPSRKGPGH